MLKATAITKRYGEVTALTGVDLAIGRGEIVCLLGENGAGKTTLFSIIVGVLPPDAGRLAIDGHDALADRDQVRALIGWAAQDPALYLTLSVAENIEYFARLAGLRRAQLRAKVQECIDALDLAELAGRRAGNLSGGQQRRVHVAMAIASGPALLLLDEPTAGLDVSARADLLEVVRRLATSGDVSILYSTHHLDEVERLDSRVVILDRGRIIADAMAAAIVASDPTDAIRLRFDGPPPRMACSRILDDGEVVVDGRGDAGRELAALLHGLGDDANRVTAIEIVRPSLESAFLRLVGRPFEATGDTQSEVHGVP
jgi:ABC-2 type transport system ATP-binding protein